MDSLFPPVRSPAAGAVYLFPYVPITDTEDKDIVMCLFWGWDSQVIFTENFFPDSTFML